MLGVQLPLDGARERYRVCLTPDVKQPHREGLRIVAGRTMPA
jgi:hypothetical protein